MKFQNNYIAVEVVKRTPGKVQTLVEARSQISTQLTQQNQQEHFNVWIQDFEGKWTSRTFCAEGYVIEKCANFESSGHPASASQACYEANPKNGLPQEGCPAPVEQTKPALPGTVTVLKPGGEQLAQRPHPAEEGSAKAPSAAP